MRPFDSARWLSVVLATLVAAPLAPFLATPSRAQDAPGLLVPDAAGDVSLVLPSSPLTLPVAQVADGIDITEASLYAETGEAFLMKVKLKDLKAEGEVPSDTTQGVNVFVCFKWGDARYALQVAYIYNTFPRIIKQLMGVLSTACDVSTAQNIVFDSSAQHSRFSVYIDPQRSTVFFAFDRLELAALTETAPPQAGEQFSEFRALVFDGRRVRIDAAPNNGPLGQSYTLVSNTANQELRAGPAANVLASIPCQGRANLKTYAIEAGGKRGIPIVLQNNATGPRTVLLSAETFIDPDLPTPDWQPRMMPRIVVPKADNGAPGNITVNVIVDTPPGTQHKDCTTVRVRAVDESDPGVFGETSVGVIAVNPPSKTLNKLYMHTNERATNVCSSQDSWLNTLEADPEGEDRDILMVYCRATPPALSVGGSVFSTFIDVNPSHDLILNTSAVQAEATAHLKFYNKAAPTQAEIVVALLSGRGPITQIAEGSAVVDIATDTLNVDIPIPISFTRESNPDGDPSRIVEAADGLGLSIQYTPVPLDSTAQGVFAPSQVWLVTSGSYIELPVWGTIKRNVNDPGANGGLLSLTALDVLPDFAAPGLPRLMNFTVLNEGAATDAAVPSVVFTGAMGWTSQVFPAGPFTLGPGEQAAFQVAVTPPRDARESTSVTVDVVVTSASDPTAKASVSHKVTASAAGGGDTLPSLDAANGGGGLPGPELGLVALAVLGLGTGLRRRRSA